jgi:hypothetical protein
MRRLMASMGMLLIAASLAHAGGAAPAKHARTTLEVAIVPAEPLPAHPRTPVRAERLAGDALAALMRATDAAHRDAVRTIALEICRSMKTTMADCLGIVARANAFLDNTYPLMEAANKD